MSGFVHRLLKPFSRTTRFNYSESESIFLAVKRNVERLVGMSVGAKIQINHLQSEVNSEIYRDRDLIFIYNCNSKIYFPNKFNTIKMVLAIFVHSCTTSNNPFSIDPHSVRIFPTMTRYVLLHIWIKNPIVLPFWRQFTWPSSRRDRRVLHCQSNGYWKYQFDCTTIPGCYVFWHGYLFHVKFLVVFCRVDV